MAKVCYSKLLDIIAFKVHRMKLFSVTQRSVLSALASAGPGAARIEQ